MFKNYPSSVAPELQDLYASNPILALATADEAQRTGVAFQIELDTLVNTNAKKEAILDLFAKYAKLDAYVEWVEKNTNKSL